jgi:hypothetical protein
MKSYVRWTLKPKNTTINWNTIFLMINEVVLPKITFLWYTIRNIHDSYYIIVSAGCDVKSWLILENIIRNLK